MAELLAAGLIIYVSGIVYFAARDNVAANDKRRFWPALLLWPIVLLLGVTFSISKRM